MNVFLGIGIILLITYVFIIGIYSYYWNKLSFWKVPSSYIPITKVTVIIPARNESENIFDCIHSILKQDYPSELLEIIIIDDFSDDDTAQIVRSIKDERIQLIQLENESIEIVNSYKKKAIEIAISKSKGDFILTTDADCIVPEHWLQLMVSFYQKNQYKFIAAPVVFYDESNALEKFQSLDFMGMMGVSGAGVEGRFMNMCNGANLGYEKNAFYEVDGFKGIDHLASGDDMLLMQKMSKKYPNGVGYLKNKDVAVKTKAKSTLFSFYKQRIRWASKSGAYPEKKITLILGIVFLLSLYLLIGIPILFIYPQSIVIFSIIFFTKMIVDYYFLRKMSFFFSKQDLLKSFLQSFFIHILYIVVIGTMSQIKKDYEWKGRKTV